MQQLLAGIFLGALLTPAHADFTLRHVKQPPNDKIRQKNVSAAKKLYAFDSFTLYPVAGVRKNGTKLSAGPDLWALYQDARILSDRWVRIVRLSDGANGWLPGWIEEKAFKQISLIHPPGHKTTALGSRSVDDALRDEPILRLQEGKSAFLWQIPSFPSGSDRILIEDYESEWMLVEKWGSGTKWFASRIVNAKDRRSGWTLDYGVSPFRHVTAPVKLEPSYSLPKNHKALALSTGRGATLLADHFRALGVASSRLFIHAKPFTVREAIKARIVPRARKSSRVYLYLGAADDAYNLKEIFADLANLPSIQILIIIAAPLPDGIPTVPKGISVLSASTTGAKLEEQTSTAQDLFTHILLTELNQPGHSTVASLFKSVKRHMQGRQKPFFKKGRWRSMRLR